MSSVPGTKETIALLERLRNTVREFAARHDATAQEWRRRTAAESKAGEMALRAQAAKLEESLAAAEAEHQSAVEKAQARFQTRSNRIQRAYQSSRKRVSELINEREGRQKYSLQRRALDAERKRDADLGAAATRLEEYRHALARSEERQSALEQSVQKAFRPVPQYRGWLSLDLPPSDLQTASDEDQLLSQLNTIHGEIESALDGFRRNLLLGFFRLIHPWLIVAGAVVAYVAVAFVLPRSGTILLSQHDATWAFGGLLIATFALYFAGKQLSRAGARLIASDLVKARHWHELARERAEARYQQRLEEINSEFESTTRQRDEEWQQVLREAEEARNRRPGTIDEKKTRASQRNTAQHERLVRQCNLQHSAAVTRLRNEIAATETGLKSSRQAQLALLEQEHRRNLSAIQSDWQQQIKPVWAEIQAAERTAAELFPDWAATRWEGWSPPPTFPETAKFGRIDVDLEKLAEVNLADKQLGFPGPAHFSLPLLLKYPDQGSLLVETAKTGFEEAVGTLNTVLFRLLAGSPPGKVSFTIIDPAGLGQNFAGLMHLADYEDNQINGRIWTQSAQIEDKLAELNEHMEKVIQMYLRNEYATITEYNTQAGAAAEKYHFLVVAGFPINFTETAARRLLNIAVSGARCGVYLLVVWDQRHALPHDFVPDDLRKNTVRLVAGSDGFAIAGAALPGTRVVLDGPPPPQFATDFLRRVGESAKDSNRVELPFEQVAPAPSERWSQNSTEEVRVPIGRAGAAKLQYLAMGRATRQHGLIAGKTGSGKSTLFHVIITNLALWCSPDEVEFYLVDFKKGVEFKCYATRRLPHARVVAIESDREFGLSVLQRIDDELRRRGDLFRKAGVQDFAGFRNANQAEKLPRLLLLIDEFQEFFTEEDRISQSAAVLLDRIVRQGRAFGIHVLLGSQTLGGAYTLARATIGQMVIRIALQCNEADAYLIMDESNAAPRLLSRPGEGIYNDMAGALEGNSPFQVVWLPDDVRDRYLTDVRILADQDSKPRPGPVVFEGNAPAEIAENQLLRAALVATPEKAPASARIWLGAPNSIKGPTEVVFQRQSASNLLVVGQSDEAILSMAAAALISLSAQYPPQTARLILIESSVPGSPEREFLDRVIDSLGVQIIRPKRQELPGTIHGLAEEIKQRTGDEDSAEFPRTFVIIAGLHNFKQLRQEEEFSFSVGETESGPSLAASLMSVLTDGSSRGVHLIATIDTYNNVSRFLGRKGLSEFQWRVLFQLSPSDSASLIESPEASKLGMHRALLFNEREGYLEKFRPYALPSNEWLQTVRNRPIQG